MYIWAINCIKFGYCFYFINSTWASQSIRCKQYGLFLGTQEKSSRRSLINGYNLSPLSDLGWAARWGSSNTCSTRWTRGTPAEQRRHQMYTSAESRQRRRRTEIQSHSPTALRYDACGVRARWASPYSCDAPPTSCCIETAPKRRSFCQPIRVLVLTYMQCPLQTCMPNGKTLWNFMQTCRYSCKAKHYRYINKQD